MRLAEVLATMSQAGEAGMGLPDEQAIRTAILAVSLAEEVAATDDERADSYWVALLRFAGCTADAHLSAAVMGDEVAVRGAMYGIDFGEPREFMSFLLRTLGRDQPLPSRVFTIASALAKLPTLMDSGRAHCEVGDRMAERFGLGERTRAALFQVFERWDGKGLPHKVRGDAIARATRIAQVAQEGEIGHRLGGVEGAAAMVRKRARRLLDPTLAEAFARRAPSLCARLEVPSVWPVFLDAEPPPHRALGDAQVTEALRAMGDFADLKTRYTRGHSSGVAALARQAATQVGLSGPEAALLERAGFVHDVGRVGVSSTLWEKPGPLSDGEWERVRLHSYATERILARAFAPLGELAAAAHERLDGRGYHRRLAGAALSPAAGVLAAADAYQAMTEERPHRAALDPARAADELRREAREGRLDGQVVEAVLGAAGHRMRARAPRPAALSDREVEVIRLLARGLTNKEIAVALDISTKTAGNHVQHVFEKAGVTTRAAAAMFAMQHGLV